MCAYSTQNFQTCYPKRTYILFSQTRKLTYSLISVEKDL